MITEWITVDGPSVWPGLMVTEQREYWHLSDPVHSGHVVRSRRWTWIGLRTWAKWREQRRREHL